MRAVRWWGREDVRVDDVPTPEDPGPGWVVLRIEACGICGTDVEEYTSGPNIIPTSPHPLSGRQAPLTLGHEPVGVVEATGDGVSLAPGTRVAAEVNLFCGECFWCKRHDYQLCVKLASLGLMADGGLADYMLAPEYMCIPVRDELPADHAALAEPLSVAVRAVRKGGVELGSNVAVVGGGTVGLLTAQAARLAGAQDVLVVERLAERRALAERLGADQAVGPEDAEDAARDRTGGIGPDVVIEAAGVPEAAVAAVQLTRKGGTAILLGVFGGAVPLDMLDLLLGEKTVRASLSHVYDDDFAAAVSLIDRGKVDVGSLITDRIGLEETVDRGFRPLISEPQAHLKIIVRPGG